MNGVMSESGNSEQPLLSPAPLAVGCERPGPRRPPAAPGGTPLDVTLRWAARSPSPARLTRYSLTSQWTRASPQQPMEEAYVAGERGGASGEALGDGTARELRPFSHVCGPGECIFPRLHPCSANG